MQHVFQPSFDDLSTPLFDVPFCTLDLETTGGSPNNCEITEVGAVKHRGGSQIGTFQTLVDPGMEIPPSITVLTGITQAMVVDAPRIEEVLPALLEFIGDSVVVGHNVRFDLRFLNAAAERLGYGALPNKWVDTAALSRRLIRPEVRNLKLRTLAAHFRSPVTPNHRALEDARATAHVFHALLERVGTMGVTNLDDLLLLPRARGSAHYSKMRLTEGLPRTSGVYVFQDRHGVPIYVGKATNLRSRVRQYFYGDERRSIANMMRELDSISHHRCETLLEAEVTELRLIHAYRPRYNRRSRPPKSSHFVKLTKERYPRLSVVRTIRDDGLMYLGPFRSKKRADQVMHAIWDAMPIRRCRSRPGSRTGKCASAQLGRAHCPCDGSLSAEQYEKVVQRLMEAIESSPDLLLAPIGDRMRQLSDQQRYEEASWLRDRHEALASALEARSIWCALEVAGAMRFEDRKGRIITVDHGRFADDAASILDYQPEDLERGSTASVPSDVGAAEEARLIWRWIESGELKLVYCSGELSQPIRRIVDLRTLMAA